jgi:hypothetical protein
MPKLVAGSAIHPCTNEVTSRTMNWLGAAGENENSEDPNEGRVEYVTPDSVHALVTGRRFTAPVVLIRFRKIINVALLIWLAVVPAGREDKLN